MRTELENLHGRFLLNLSFMQQCPVESIVNSMAGMERIKDGYALLPNIKSGGETFQPPQPISFTNLLLLYQHASLNAYKLQRKVLFGTQLYKPMAFSSSLSVSRKGGGRNGDDDLAPDPSLVHSQLQVRGGVSPGQYHSPVVAI